VPSLLSRLSVALCLLLSLAGAAWARDPAPCAPDGSLDYYRCRADDFVAREPSRSPPDYYLDYGDRYVRRFSEETRPLLSPEGQRWLDRVRGKLQEAIEARRASDPFGFALLELEPERLADFAFDTHPEAYLQAGLAELPLRDLILIGSTPDAQDILSARARAQIARVIRGLVGACRAQGLGRCLVERALTEARERRRLYRDRLRLRPSGTLGGWLVRRAVESARRALRPQPASLSRPSRAGIRSGLQPATKRF
jgi:hypothetical protein